MTVRRTPVAVSLLLAVAVVAGCNGRSAQEAGSAAPTPATIKRVARDTLPAVDDYLGIALDDGRVRIAPPSEWDRAPRSAKYLAAFLRTRKSQVPRIVVNADDSPYPNVNRVDESNVVDFAVEVGRHLQETGANVVETPLPMVIGPNAYARYVLRQGQHSGVALQRQMLVTVFDNRLYEIDLAVFENRIVESRDFAYAVAAAIQFQKPEAQDTTTPETTAEPLEAKNTAPAGN